GPLPIVTLLHGVYGSHWVWSQKAGVHLTAQRMIDAGALPPMLIAMPSDGLMFDGSAYLPHNDRDFAAWIVEDVPDALIAAGLPTDAEAPRFIAGLSMGGYGALRLGAAFPDRFAAFAGHSSITDFDQLPTFIEEPAAAYGPASTERSVFETMRANRSALRPFRFDCGVDDPLIEHNRTLHRALTTAGIDHVYEEYPGGHEWPYWTRHIVTTLTFFAEHLPS
ncbi:MAG: alpha/beta hydrolase-fold protein, partial [Planctomycetota bacterium]